MNPTCRNRTKGRMLYVDGGHLYKSINNSLWESLDNGHTWRAIYEIKPERSIDRSIYKSHAACRLYRKGIHHLNRIGEKDIGIIFDKKIAILSDGKLKRKKSIKGSRPLSFQKIGDELVFGEYRSNPERSEIGVFGIGLNSNLHKKIGMTGVRHIHGIYQDPYTGSVWISTGEDGGEETLFLTDEQFNNPQKILFGKRQYRTIKLVFTKTHIYFGSDAPEEANHLYRMDKTTHAIENLGQVDSSVFHGCKLGDWLFFSTAVEPSKVNKTRYAEVWASPNGTDWKCVLRFKKDILPMKLFQYGQVFFPIGKGRENELWISPFGTECSNESLCYKVDDFNPFFE